jgi:hypothetical protein
VQPKALAVALFLLIFRVGRPGKSIAKIATLRLSVVVVVVVVLAFDLFYIPYTILLSVRLQSLLKIELTIKFYFLLHCCCSCFICFNCFICFPGIFNFMNHSVTAVTIGNLLWTIGNLLWTIGNLLWTIGNLLW